MSYVKCIKDKYWFVLGLFWQLNDVRTVANNASLVFNKVAGLKETPSQVFSREYCEKKFIHFKFF